MWKEGTGLSGPKYIMVIVERRAPDATVWYMRWVARENEAGGGESVAGEGKRRGEGRRGGVEEGKRGGGEIHYCTWLNYEIISSTDE